MPKFRQTLKLKNDLYTEGDNNWYLEGNPYQHILLHTGHPWKSFITVFHLINRYRRQIQIQFIFLFWKNNLLKQFPILIPIDKDRLRIRRHFSS